MAELLSNLLADAAASRGEHPAVEDARGSLTYAELAERAGVLAAELCAAGVERGDRVGVCLPKSNDAVASLYGIMWSGGAYVPLDVAAPPARLAYMIRNCGMRLLVTCQAQVLRLGNELGDSCLERIILVDAEAVPDKVASKVALPVVAWGDLARRDALRQPVGVAADDLAYILYTSGSTGEPKGVMISHRNALAFVEWAREAVEVRADDRLSSHAPFHFDLSIFDLYVASLAQATVVLVPDGMSLFPASLAEWIETQRINVWYSVPSILVQLMDRGRIDRFPLTALRKMIFAGEVFASRYLRDWMNRLPKADWYNFYGPTETNVCTWYRVPAPPEGDTPISIGCASSSDTIYLRDRAGKLITETGAEGEICVEGPTVALGYWGDPQKTGRRFVTEPDLTGTDHRIYCTGDLACWDEEGNLSFRGRRDHMIKSRGYRIELGEIEAAAFGHAAVQEAAAVAVPDDEIGNRIRACVVLHAGQELDRDGLIQHLSGRLPAYMLPQEVQFLSVLPKTSTGKVDRRALSTEAVIS